MSDITKARETINKVDKQIANLFEQRMLAAKQVAEYKKERGLEIEDKTREAELIEREREFIATPELKSYYTNFLQNMMDISKRYQHSLIHGRRVAYSGVPGAFAAITAGKIFADAKTVPYPDFKAAYNAVCDGECDVAVLPIENSLNGDVGPVLDLTFFGPLHITGVYDTDIVQNLIAPKGATLDTIKRVISHPQALGQCSEYIRAHGFEEIEAVNTAVAAQKVAEDGDITVAAIGSDEAALKYGLKKLDSHINGNGTNTTRFAVFSRSPREKSATDNRFIMMFTVKNEPGSLGRAVSAIGESGFNLRALKSRPTKALMWSYYFYAEGEGAIGTKEGEKMIERLSENCIDVRIIGSYEKEIIL